MVDAFVSTILQLLPKKIMRRSVESHVVVFFAIAIQFIPCY